MSTTVAESTLQKQMASLRSGNIFTALHLPFDIVNAIGDTKLAQLSEDYQKKWEGYAKQHKLNMAAIDAATYRIKRTYVLRLMYDEKDFERVQSQLNSQIATATKDLAAAQSQSSGVVATAISELLLGTTTTTDEKTKRTNFMILSVVVIGFIILAISLTD